MYSTVIVPTEKPPTVLDIKRALLSYDKVYLVNPSDRDIIPPQLFMSVTSQLTTGIPFPIQGGNNPVRPLGKTKNYDNEFDKVIDEFQVPIKEGIVEVIETYIPSDGRIGSIDLGGFPVNPAFLFQLHKTLINNSDFVNLAFSGDELSNRSREEILNLGMNGCDISSMNGGPKAQMIDGFDDDQELKFYLSQIAYGRIATALKFSCFCESKNLVPSYTDNIQQKLLLKLIKGSQNFIDKAYQEEGDIFWLRVNRLQNLLYQDFIDSQKLGNLSVQDTLKFRSKNWFTASSKRQQLFDSIRDIALNTSNDEKFEDTCKKEIEGYLQVASILEDERRELNQNFACDLGSKASYGTAGMIMGQIILPNFGSMASVLLAGSLFINGVVGQHMPEYLKIKQKEKKFKSTAGFGLYNSTKSLLKPSSQ